MRLSFGQHLQQKQVQTLAPRMIQSMEILQMPAIELQEHIEQALAENPMLELNESDPTLPEDPVEHQDLDKPDVDQKELIVDNDKNNTDDFERLLNQPSPETYEDYSKPSSNRIAESGERQHDQMANIVDRPESLQEHLRHQLCEMDLTPEMLKMCERVISSLSAEDGGYLRLALADLLPPDSGQEEMEIAESALAVIQALDPPGVAARDLTECLLLQIKDEMPYADEMRTLVQSHLDNLHHNRMPAIQKATGFSIETLSLIHI